MPSPPLLDEGEFDSFRAIIYREAGIRVPEAKRVLLSNRVRRRVAATGRESFGEYLSFVRSPLAKDELAALVDAVTTNETWFFRTPEQFDWVLETFLPEKIAAVRREKKPAGRKPRLACWSAAASTGAEAYSLAILFAEQGLSLRAFDISILGTDVSGEAIDQAEAGVFPARLCEDLTDRQRSRHFRELPPAGGSPQPRYEIRPEIRAAVRFARHNLMRQLPSVHRPPGGFDLVFLRNVLIYFDGPSKSRVLSNLVPVLAPGGYLVVGPSDNLPPAVAGLERVGLFVHRRTGPAAEAGP